MNLLPEPDQGTGSQPISQPNISYVSNTCPINCDLDKMTVEIENFSFKKNQNYASLQFV